jgi:hypothetical protein
MVRRQFIHRSMVRLWTGRAVRVDDGGVLLWIPQGSAFIDTYARDGRTLRDLSNDDWYATPKFLKHLHWQGNRLMWHPAGEPYSVWFRFSDVGDFHDYYVNLEVPGAVWRDEELAGIDTVDWDLDVVARADLVWRYKDVEEFEDRLLHPDYWVDDEAEVRAAAGCVIKLIEAAAFPFDGTWVDFRPDPNWTPMAEVPPGWDRPRAVGRRLKRDMDVMNG